MNIDLAECSKDQYAEAIRSHLVCGACTASTLLCWESLSYGSNPKGTTIAAEIENDIGSTNSVCFLVRCSFFRFNVVKPEQIVVCEGFKARKETSD